MDPYKEACGKVLDGGMKVVHDPARCKDPTCVSIHKRASRRSGG